MRKGDAAVLGHLDTCCCTGHRVIDRAHRDNLPALLAAELRHLIKEGATTFLVGGAVGFDTLAAE